MASIKRTTTSLPTQQAGAPRASQSRLDWNVAPKESYTPRSEYAFMEDYSLICATSSNGNFGPVDGGVTL